MIISELRYENMNQYLNLIKQLSPEATVQCGSSEAVYILSMCHFKRTFLAFKDGDFSHKEPIGCISVLLENKVNRAAKGANKMAIVAHIEEMVIDKDSRGSGVGKSLVEHAVKFAKERGAYKVILDCSEDNVGFYEKCGFRTHEVSMRIDL